jgi:hypothetical protein
MPTNLKFSELIQNSSTMTNPVDDTATSANTDEDATAGSVRASEVEQGGGESEDSFGDNEGKKEDILRDGESEVTLGGVEDSFLLALEIPGDFMQEALLTRPLLQGYQLARKIGPKPEFGPFH